MLNRMFFQTAFLKLHKYKTSFNPTNAAYLGTLIYLAPWDLICNNKSLRSNLSKIHLKDLLF